MIGTRGFPGVQGGVEMHSQHLYTTMSRNFDDITVRVYRRKPYLTEQSATTFPHIEYIDLPSTRIKGFEAMFHTLLCVLHIAVHRPAVVHVHNIGPGLFTPLLRLLGLKVVLTYHSPNYEHAKWGALARRILRLGERLSLKCAHKVIFVNKFQQEKCGAIAMKKGVYIPNGIDPARPTTATSFLERHGIVAGNYVLAVGRITPEKGFEHLIAAAQQVHDVQQVVIAGASDHDNAYKERLQALDVNHKVVFTGFTAGDDLSQLYSHARVYALSSVNEGFPLVLLEAMSYGLPIVASDIPATHLVTLPPSSYFTAGDTQALATALQHALNAPAHEAIAYELSSYNWDNIAQSTLEVYRQVNQ